MVWPEREDNWRLGAKPAQEGVQRRSPRRSIPSDPVTMAVSVAAVRARACGLPAEVRVVEMTTDDAWMRDTGPTFVVNGRGERRAVDWHFNAWGGLEGGLYFPWDKDDLVAEKVAEIEGAARYRAPLILEGGSIHVDGEGTCLTTEECLLNRNRNPELTREDIEGHLRDHLGIETVIWLGRGIYLDETDGHVDNIACFLRPGVVALTVCADPDDPQHEISQDARARLDAATDARGRSLEVVELPMPGPILISEDEAHSVDHIEDTLPRRPGDRLAGSYANFYIGTSRVVVPLLDERLDDEILEILGAQFPGREVVGVPAREILLGGGNIHCITQQVPAV